MGQYYNILLKPESAKRWQLYDRSVDGKYQPAKLTEHSWIGNYTLECVMELLRKEPSKLVWIGDYAASYTVPDCKTKAPNSLTDKDIESLFKKAWGSKAYKAKTLNSAERCSDKDIYIVNHDKGEFLDLNAYMLQYGLDDGWIPHPLSLLTALGNGFGGGDYCGNDKEYIGRWAGDKLSVEKAEPPVWFNGILPRFKEE